MLGFMNFDLSRRTLLLGAIALIFRTAAPAIGEQQPRQPAMERIATEYVRSLGDLVTRLDRTEPSLNSAIKGDDRDTTSPASMLSDMNALLLGDQLSKESGQRLEAWMVANTTGAKRLRAGLPSTWRVGDKTGTGENGAAADIAILLRPDRAPILVAVYLAGSTKPSPDLSAAFADVGRIIADAF